MPAGALLTCLWRIVISPMIPEDSPVLRLFDSCGVVSPPAVD